MANRWKSLLLVVSETPWKILWWRGVKLRAAAEPVTANDSTDAATAAGSRVHRKKLRIEPLSTIAPGIGGSTEDLSRRARP